MSLYRMGVLISSSADYSQAFPRVPYSWSFAGICIREEWELPPAAAFTPGPFLSHAASHKQRKSSQNVGPQGASQACTPTFSKETDGDSVIRNRHWTFCGFVFIAFIVWGFFYYKIRTCSRKESYQFRKTNFSHPLISLL